MKKLLYCAKTAITLLIVTVLFIGVYAYMLSRPISYGMSYHNETEYEGVEFEGTLKFYPNGKVVNDNTNFDEAFETYYYYKDGYVFSLMAQTDDEYEVEVSYIDENFDEAVDIPFYAAKINAFKYTASGPDNYVASYTCVFAIVFAIVGGILALALVALTASSFVLSKKAKE